MDGTLIEAWASLNWMRRDGCIIAAKTDSGNRGAWIRFAYDMRAADG